MAEILELDNVIINLQDLIKPPTILILLSWKHNGKAGLVEWEIAIVNVYAAEMPGRGRLLFKQYIPTNKTSLFILSIKNDYWLCLLSLYAQVLQDHLLSNVCSEFGKNDCYDFKLCFFVNYGSLMTYLCGKDQQIFLHVKLSGFCPSLWQFQLVFNSHHPREGNGCDKEDSVKQLMSLSIIALVPIYRANKSKSPQMKHRSLWTHVCSQVTENGSTWVSQVTL